ncbi:NAD(P)-dependent oxidoreductase [bacterium]|jgi:nucleoside-diphosphate-sugar epimerase|nr:NAD(P)-dependent oxidoreductase [bacterium]
MEKIYLITGAAGFIGSHLARRLYQQGENISLIVRPSSNLYRIKEIPSKNVIECDITNLKSLTRIIKKVNPTHIIHFATHGVYRNQTDINKIINVNLNGSLNLFKASTTLKNLELSINTGSVYEYGSLKGEMKESIVAKARNIYDATKISTTALAQAFTSLELLPICTIRPFTAYGPTEDKSRLTSTIISMIKKGKNPRIAPNAIRDFIYIDDLIDGYIKVLNLPNAVIGETINFGSGKPTKIKDFVSQIISSLGSKIETIDAPEYTNPNDSQCWADISKAETLLKWKPKTINKKGIEETIKKYDQ